jgi:hypothetical protein
MGNGATIEPACFSSIACGGCGRLHSRDHHCPTTMTRRNRFAGRLEYSDNVRLLSARGPESVPREELGAVVHCQSFSQRDVVDNIARPRPCS